MDREKAETNIITFGAVLILISIVFGFIFSAFVTAITALAGVLFCSICYKPCSKHTKELLRIYLVVFLIVLFIYGPKI